MLLSIIVPVYNCEKTITRTFLSISQQLDSVSELIFVNDGSIDSSLSVIEKLIGNKPNISIVNQENKGLVQARKSGIDNSRGKYIFFVDGGDELSQNAIRKILSSINEFDADYFVINHKTIVDKNIYLFEENPLFLSNINNLFLGYCPYSICFKIFKKQFYNDLILYNWPIKITNAEDLCYSVELMNKTSNAMLIDDYLYIYNKEKDSMSNNYNKDLAVLKALDFVFSYLQKALLISDEFFYLVYSKTIIPILFNNSLENNRKLYSYYKKYNIGNNRYIKHKRVSELLSYVCIKSKIMNNLISIIMGKIYGK